HWRPLDHTTGRLRVAFTSPDAVASIPIAPNEAGSEEESDHRNGHRSRRWCVGSITRSAGTATRAQSNVRAGVVEVVIARRSPGVSAEAVRPLVIHDLDDLEHAGFGRRVGEGDLDLLNRLFRVF